MKNIKIEIIGNNNECYKTFANSVDINNETISINEIGNKIINILSSNITKITIENLNDKKI